MHACYTAVTKYDRPVTLHGTNALKKFAPEGTFPDLMIFTNTFTKTEVIIS